LRPVSAATHASRLHDSVGARIVYPSILKLRFADVWDSVLAVDSFSPGGIGGTAEDQMKLSMTDNTRDAFAARRYLISLGPPRERMAIMGFSRGGVVATRAADLTYLPEEKDRFLLAIPFYPGCNTRPREPKPASIVFMALGEKDDYTGVKLCEDVAADFTAAGGKITVKIYPDSAHGFDGNPESRRMVRMPAVENYMDCVVSIEPDGRQSYGGQTLAAEHLAIYELLRKSCVRKGAKFWVNPRQKENATRDEIAFLQANFK
jgi:dienelactone hydrolase